MTNYSQQSLHPGAGDELNGIRIALHSMIDSSDDRLVKMMYALATEYNSDLPLLAEPDPEELQIRTERRRSGESKLMNWEQAKSSIRQK